MSKIISFEEHSKKYKFEEQIVSVFTEKNEFYEFLEDGDLGVGFLHHNQYIYVFFSYIPRGDITSLPTLTESFAGVRTSDKVSQGEWFVDRILALKKEVALKTLPLIYAKDKKKGWLRAFKNQVLHNITESELSG